MTDATTPPITAPRAIWEVDPVHTSVEFRVKHIMVATITGRFSGVRGRIVGDVEDPEHAEVDVTIDTSAIDTRHDERDAHMRSADFLDVERYPTITFRSTRVERVSQDELKVTGDLTICGVTREVTLDVTINGVTTASFGTEVMGLTAKTALNRKDFGLDWNVALEAGGWLVGDTVTIEIDVEADRVP
jgi:polyisoprenoid-binding protein YceI